mgnify:CR=1 FL=1
MLQEEAENLGEEGFAEDVSRIHTAGRHLLLLINEILDLSKVEAGRMGLYLEMCSIQAMIKDVVAITQPLADQNGNQLRVCLGRDLTVFGQVTEA